MEGIWARNISICFRVPYGPWAFWDCPYLAVPSVDNFRDVWGSFPNPDRWQRRVAWWSGTVGGTLFFLGASGNIRCNGMYSSTSIYLSFETWKALLVLENPKSKPFKIYIMLNFIWHLMDGPKIIVQRVGSLLHSSCCCATSKQVSMMWTEPKVPHAYQLQCTCHMMLVRSWFPVL